MEEKNCNGVRVIKKAFLLTGHRNWGKSQTLNDPNFAGKNLHVIINGFKVKIKKSSNGDDPDGVLDFIEKNKNEQFLIIAFCCDNDPSYKGQDIIKKLKSYGYNLYAFVLEHQYPPPQDVIPRSEIQTLGNDAQVYVYSQKGAVAPQRAADFMTYLGQNIP
jgi:hypothetical protein